MAKQKIYLAHPCSQTYQHEETIRLGKLIRDFTIEDAGYEVFIPAEQPHNDKTTQPTPKDIVDNDLKAIEDCDIFLINLTGGKQDGTLLELGMAAAKNKTIIAYTTNTRLLDNVIVDDNLASASVNHMALGIVQRNGIKVNDKWICSKSEMLDELITRLMSEDDNGPTCAGCEA